MRHVKKFILVIFIAFALPAWAGGDSSDGHSHGAPTPAPAPISQGATPRTATTTEEFEVVAAFEGQNLVVYVDHFASNEPVARAKVEIEGTRFKGIASETAPGTYMLPIPSPLPPAKHALTISIESAESADLLAVTLDTSTSAAHVAPTHGQGAWTNWAIGAVAAALLLVSAIVFIVQRRQGAKRRI
ncbi:MAG: hypothetical protein IPH35_25565 [Rhodoferax sp.]|nr:hypothetical protein [Rhodoferax sp.]